MKKALSVLLALVLMLSLHCVAFARYTYISAFGLNGELTETTAYAEVFTDLNEARPSQTVLTLERSADGGKTFEYYVTMRDKKTNSMAYLTSGRKIGLSPDYIYRIKAEINVFDSNDNLLEYDFMYWDEYKTE